MKFFKFNLFFLIFITFFFSCSTSKQIFFSENNSSLSIDEFITIDFSNISPFNNGVFEGWGTSLCWWANRIGDDLELTENAEKMLFTSEGLNLNIARYNIGGGDNPSHNHIKRTDSAMEGFLILNEESNKYEYDWTRDPRQVKVLKDLSKNKNIIFEFFSNSPPYFMTESNCSSGNKYGILDNLKTDKFDDFADYLATVCEYFSKTEKIKIKSLSPMNEAQSFSWTAYSTKQEGCHFSQGKTQSEILYKTKQALLQKNLYDIEVSGTEETNIDTQISSINKFSPEAIDSISRINTHSYTGFNKKGLRKITSELNKGLWMSESDYPYTVGFDNGEMGPALALGKKIIDDLNGLQPSAWIIWQAIANYVATEPFNGNYDKTKIDDYSRNVWGLATADLDNHSLILSKKFFGFAQFTKFINPGDKILYLNKNNYLASISPEQNKIKIVCINDKSKNKTISVNTGDYKVKSFETYRTNGKNLSEGNNCDKISSCTDLKNNFVILNLAPYSISTFILEVEKNNSNFL